MKKYRNSKVVKLINFFASLQLLTVLLWESSLEADSINTPMPASSEIILWGTFLTIGLSLAFWAHLRARGKKWRRRHILAGAQENLMAAENRSNTILQN